MNLVEAGAKRMGTLLHSYEEMSDGLREAEKNERNGIIRDIRDALKLVREDFNRQTKSFEMGGGFRPMQAYQMR